MNTDKSNVPAGSAGGPPDLPAKRKADPTGSEERKNRIAEPGAEPWDGTLGTGAQPADREDEISDRPLREDALVEIPPKQAPPRAKASSDAAATERLAGVPAGAMEDLEISAEPAPLARPRPEWKVLEPEDRADAVDHEVCEVRRRNERWDIVAASVRGKLHAHKAMWREDAYGIDWIDDWTMIAVSDGAGSAELSRIGARVACDESVAALKRLLAGWHPKAVEGGRPPEADLIRLRAFLVEAARKAQEGILRAAQARQCSPRKMHATLLLLVHVPLGADDLVGAIQIGDGAVGIFLDDGTCTLLGVPDHGEYSSETRFLTTPNIEREFERRVLFSFKQGIRCLGVMCDGVADDFFPEDKRLVELFVGNPIEGMRTKDDGPVLGVMREVVGNPRDGESLRDWLRYEKKASSDDRTLVLMYRRADA